MRKKKFGIKLRWNLKFEGFKEIKGKGRTRTKRETKRKGKKEKK